MNNADANFHWKERYVYILLISVSILVFFMVPSQVGEGEPRWIPYSSMVIILLCSIVCLIRCFRTKEIIVSIPKSTFFIWSLGVVLYGAYIYLIDIFGFYGLTFIFLMVLIFMLKNENKKVVFLTSILTPLVLYLLLEQLLGLNLPSYF